MTNPSVLVVGGTGTTGKRVAERLRQLGRDVRIGSRSAERPFVWEDSGTWGAAVENMGAAYIAHPGFTAPGGPEQIVAFVKFAVSQGVRRLVLLSARADKSLLSFEDGVIASGADWTIVRPGWFNQNFSEGFFRDSVLSGEFALPVGDAREPFVDAGDIVDVVVAALRDDKHIGKIYELSGPRALDFTEVAAELARATGRTVVYKPLTREQFVESLRENGLPEEMAEMYGDLTGGDYAHVVNGVYEVLGRQPKDFTDFARDAAAAGAWNT